MAISRSHTPELLTMANSLNQPTEGLGRTEQLATGLRRVRDDAEQAHNTFSAIESEFNRTLRSVSSVTSPARAWTLNNFRKHFLIQHKTFTNIIWKSRDVAGKAQSTLDDLLHSLMPILRDPSVSAKHQSSETRLMMKYIDEDKAEAESLAQNLLELYSRIIRELEDWQHFAPTDSSQGMHRHVHARSMTAYQTTEQSSLWVSKARLHDYEPRALISYYVQDRYT
ncbi:hypothetical protein EIP91_005971 [Steccherinum ochraceum]|uniref:Uncharacterized protein n=1 Tax=Steccherinum ochraceum TaxID=92696 RepID=A0A4R0R996_9APHY|nr:hypothetical protein EIP91_005971 [Steccherinum ochraceum]